MRHTSLVHWRSLPQKCACLLVNPIVKILSYTCDPLIPTRGKFESINWDWPQDWSILAYSSWWLHDVKSLMDLSWCHICIGIKVIFSNNKDFSVWLLHALFFLYALEKTMFALSRIISEFYPRLPQSEISTCAAYRSVFASMKVISNYC